MFKIENLKSKKNKNKQSNNYLKISIITLNRVHRFGTHLYVIHS